MKYGGLHRVISPTLCPAFPLSLLQRHRSFSMPRLRQCKCSALIIQRLALFQIVASLGCFLLLFTLVHRETKQIVAGLAAAGLYAASFRFTGAWMDLAKTDSLALFLILTAFFAGQRNSSPLGLMFSGILFGLSYFVKQIALPIVVALAAVTFITSRGRAWRQWTSAAITGIGIFLLLESFSNGWFSFYTLDSYMYHERMWNLWPFWRTLLRTYWPALILSCVYFFLSVARTRGHISDSVESRRWHYLALGIAFILTSWSTFFKVWTYDNGYMPAAAGIALLAGLGLGKI